MRAAIPAILLGALALVGLHEWKGLSYWNYSEGVYALSSRALLDGADLYGDVVGAQPPGVYVSGAAALAFDDSLSWLRLAVGMSQLVAALIAAYAVHRLTRSALAAAFVAPAGLLLPWAVHEHGHLTPETIGAPLVLGAAVLAARGGRAAIVAGVLVALAVWTKFPFALPGAAILALAADRRSAIGAAAASLALLAGISTAIFGSGLWRDAVEAQLQIGTRELSDMGGFTAQAGWNLVGLLVPAAAALVLRERVRDPALLRTLSAAAGGGLLGYATVLKEGTNLNVLVPIEALLLPLAACGVVLALSVPRWRVAAPAAAALVLAQGVGLVAGTGPFLRPFSASAHQRDLTTAEVKREADAARNCPPDTRHSGTPFIAFVATRPMPDGQPDQYVTAHADVHADVLERMRADGPLCP